MITPRPYQELGMMQIRQSYKYGSKFPLYVLPTGGGKTVVFCLIALAAVKKHRRVLILVHRVELLRQTSNALTKAAVSHGLINPKYTPDLTCRVQVASVQTMVNRLDQYGEFDLIIVDEAHHATAGSWKKIINHYPNALGLGVTATPCRGDGQGLEDMFDDLVMGPQIPELIHEGYLVEPIIYAPSPDRVIDFSSVKTVRGDYDSKQLVEVMDKPTITGDAVAHYSKICPGEPCVVFCVSVDHAKHVAAEFREAGFKAYSVDGSMDDDVRTRILDGLGNGTIEVVTSCDLISEGTDIPAISCAILLRPTQSLGLYIQQVGRALRTAEGKTRAIVLDHVGNVSRHGFPDEHREWDLAGKIRGKGKKKEVTIPMNQCTECYAVHPPAPSCPYCGAIRKIQSNEIQQVEGELVQISKEEKQRIRFERTRAVAETAKLPEDEQLAELIKLAKKLGHKVGWAYKMLEVRKAKKEKSENL